MIVSRTHDSKASGTFAFARHETFHLRDGWLSKGLEAARHDGFSLYAKDAHHMLGIGINMLKAVIYWLQATNLVQIGEGGGRYRLPMRLTELGELVHIHDPFLEDIGTLWLLHIELASNQRLATFWYWVFNEFPQRDFNEDRLVQGVHQFLLEKGTAGIALHSLEKDARCFVRTYLPSRDSRRKTLSEDALDCPLTVLSLLREGHSERQHKFNVGQHRNLPLELFAYTLYRLKEHLRPGEVVLSLEDLRWAPLSPGRLLCLDNKAVLEYLEELEHRTSKIHIVRAAGLNMVALDEGVRGYNWLREYYAGHGVQDG